MTKIGIIGSTGNMGKEITKAFLNENTVNVYSNNREKLQSQIEELSSSNLNATESIEVLVDQSDVIVLALPYMEEQKVANEIKDIIGNKVVVSISNPLKEDYSGLTTGWDKSAAELLSEKLGTNKVVKAFNTIFAGRINNADINGMKIDHLIAGNDEEAIKLIEELVASIGHNPIVAGSLDNARMLEHMAFLNISLSLQKKFNWDSAFKLIS